MGFNIEKTPAASQIQGLGYVTKATSPLLSISSFSLAAGTNSNFTTTATAAVTDAASLNLVLFSGVGNTDVNNQWCLLNGSMYFRNAANADIGAVLQRSSSGQTLTVQLRNTSGAPVTVPNITVSLRSVFYTAPWD